SYNLLLGLLLGLGYSLFELPNSFLKRRLDIIPGKPTTGIKKYFFVFLDQADSVFGCCLVVCLFDQMSFAFYLLYVLVGALTHIIVNMLLYAAKLRKNMF
ncbi:MAG: CDP-archaeol synthase, partial [Clostridia bacterium]|nr:CDP-archaeol synthase [Clostridia bacterium]